MSAADFRTIAFGALEPPAWSVAVSAGSAVDTLLGPQGTQTAALEGSSLDGDWLLRSNAGQTQVTAAGEAVHAEGSVFQLCRVRAEESFSSLAVRSAMTLDLDKLDSVRHLAAWFEEPTLGIALTAQRPRGAADHGSDLITAAILEPESSSAVLEPRLSTTYTADGRPRRANLELWLEGVDDEQYPRRAAGTAVGSAASASAADLEVRAELFRWHSGGSEGAGIYLLVGR